ncbi:MAG: hypothetical protein GX045_06040 [Clostridiaceae bacterium]|jgi:hypothetical protein|nr:hypothetical protein [Clostridiaceae bacterium]
MEADKHLNNTRKIAIAGILTSLGTVALILENIVPTGKLGFYVFAGFLLSVIIMECGLTYGWISFGATSLTAFILVPEKTAVIPFVLFFGIYSIIKNYIERINRIIVELILKFGFFNLSLYFMWSIARHFIPETLFRNFPVIVLIILLQLVFFVFDWIFTLWTRFYLEILSPRIKRQ